MVSLERQILDHGPIVVGVFLVTSSVVSGLTTFVHYKLLGFEFTPYANLDPGIVLALLPHGLLLAVVSIAFGWLVSHEENRRAQKITQADVQARENALAQVKGEADIASSDIRNAWTEPSTPGPWSDRMRQHVLKIVATVGAGFGYALAKARVVAAWVSLWRVNRLAARKAQLQRISAGTMRREFWGVVCWAVLISVLIATPVTAIATDLRSVPLREEEFCATPRNGLDAALLPECIDLYIKEANGISRKTALYEVGRFADKSYYIVLNGRNAAGGRKCRKNDDGSFDCHERLVIAHAEILYQTQMGAPRFERLGETSRGGDNAELLNLALNMIHDMKRDNALLFTRELGAVSGVTPETLRCRKQIDKHLLKVSFDEHRTRIATTEIQAIIAQAAPLLSGTHATGTKLVLYGFASDTGSAPRNFYLSEARARWVAEQVVAWFDKRKTQHALGQTSPHETQVAADDTPALNVDVGLSVPVVPVGRGEAWRYRFGEPADVGSLDDSRVVLGVLCTE